METKYSFTAKDDLAWITDEYGAADRQRLIDNYQKFLDDRYAIIKEKFMAFFKTL